MNIDFSSFDFNRFYKYGFYVLFFVLLIILIRSCGANKATSSEQSDEDLKEVGELVDSILVSYNGRSFDYAKRFADTNIQHLSAAQNIGLSSPPANRQEAQRMHMQLYEVRSNQNFIIEELTHSMPYLVPVAFRRLDAIGKEWEDILERNDLPHYRFRITSILRSGEDIEKLRKTNSNAAQNSAHNYGTTFDIAYWHYDKVTRTNKYMTEDNLKLVLAQVLLNQQREGHIYVKYERKQCCFHVTVRD